MRWTETLEETTPVYRVGKAPRKVSVEAPKRSVLRDSVNLEEAITEDLVKAIQADDKAAAASPPAAAAVDAATGCACGPCSPRSASPRSASPRTQRFAPLPKAAKVASAPPAEGQKEKGVDVVYLHVKARLSKVCVIM